MFSTKEVKLNGAQSPWYSPQEALHPSPGDPGSEVFWKFRRGEPGSFRDVFRRQSWRVTGWRHLCKDAGRQGKERGGCQECDPDSSATVSDPRSIPACSDICDPETSDHDESLRLRSDSEAVYEEEPEMEDDDEYDYNPKMEKVTTFLALMGGLVDAHPFHTGH